MDYYLCIKLLPDEECPVYFLRNTCVTKLHKMLHESNQTHIGISFPNYITRLGDVIRLHGDKNSLKSITHTNWLGGLVGYCELTGILAVPDKIEGYRAISRKQPTMSPAKLRRLLKRGSITDEEANNYKAKMFTKGLDAPYLELVSGSNGQRHRRYIEFGPLLDSPVEGEFDQFGLSKTATIPWF